MMVLRLHTRYSCNNLMGGDSMKRIFRCLIAILMCLVCGFTGCKNHNTIDSNTEKTFSISYQLDGGIFTEEAPVTCESGEDIIIPSPVRRAHTFLGWSLEKNGAVEYEANDVINISKNITLYAQFRYDPTNIEFLQDTVIQSYPDFVYQSISEKIVSDYMALGFEVYNTIVEGIFTVCYYYPDMLADGIMPCGVVLLNYPLQSQVPVEIEIKPVGKDYVLLSSFESEGLGQYQYKENDAYFLYEVVGSIAYIEYYNTVEAVDNAISSGISNWDLTLYSWNYDEQDFLTIPFGLLPEFDSSKEYLLFESYTTSKLIEELQTIEILKSATSIETFSGVFFSEELAKYIEECMLSGTQILLNNVPLEEVVAKSTELATAGKLICLNLDGSISTLMWAEEWTADKQFDLIEQQIEQIQDSLLVMGATVVASICLAPFTGGLSLQGTMLVGFAFGAGAEFLQQVVVENRGLSELDFGALLLQGTLGSVTAGLSMGACKWMEAVSKTSVTLARAMPLLVKGLDITLDISATLAYDLYMGYSQEQIRSDIAMTVISNAAISLFSSACFEGDTLIETPDRGSVPISSIKTGDSVISFQNGKQVVGKVGKVYVRQAPIWNLTLSNGKTIKTTENHPFYVLGEFIAVKDLEIGDCLLDINGQNIYISSISYENYLSTVYNFEVLCYNVYYADGVLVHNSCGPKILDLISNDYQNVKYKSNYHPANAEVDTKVYLLTINNDEALDKMVGGRILEVYPQLEGKTYREACVFIDGRYVLKVGTTITDGFNTRYPSNKEFIRLYGLEKSDITWKLIAKTKQSEALMIESQVLKHLSLSCGKPLPANSNFTEYRRTTMYNYRVGSNSDIKIEWKITNWEKYLGYGN